MPSTVDITPSPRILRTLGHIPFQPWQCIAELLDNSLDGFRQTGASTDSQPRIVVSWSTEAAADERVIEIVDNGPGMTQETLNASVRAGHSNNDPMNNLGLFGMGFNIATARLGDRTTVMSATRESAHWVCIEIDFHELGVSNAFSVPLTFVAKAQPEEHGTKVIVSKLNAGIVQQLRNQETLLRRQLEDVYTTILQDTQVNILVQGKALVARPHCLWSAQRYAVRRSERVPAVIQIEEVLGEALFDTARNQYLTPAEEAVALQKRDEQGSLPAHLVQRPKRVHGWLGIQRYSDPDDFGIDFLRNGRKILLRDKTLFHYNNPLTSRSELEYPNELGTTLGGRIVGEIHLDHVPPTYQKNDFQRADPSWAEMVSVLRGDGPILPRRRTAMGFDGENTSPIGRLISAYRRSDSGVKCLAAPNDKAKEWLKKFRLNEIDYLTDEKWFEAAREADRTPRQRGKRGAPSDVDTGGTASDDPSMYIGGGNGSALPTGGVTVQPTPPTPMAPALNPVEELRTRSTKSETYSGEYEYEDAPAPFVVNVWEVHTGVIGNGDEGDPCLMAKDANVCDFFYNPRHTFLRGYPTTWRELLLVYLAERFKVRDDLANQDLALLFVDLMRTNFTDSKLDLNSVQERGHAFFERLRESALGLLRIREREAVDCIYESSGEVEEIVNALIQNVSLLGKFQARAPGSIEAVPAVPPRTLVRLVDRFPEEFFDAKFFSTPYTQISLPDTNATERLRQRAKERIVMFLKDALWIITDTTSQIAQNVSKEDIARCQHSITSLNSGVVV